MVSAVALLILCADSAADRARSSSSPPRPGLLRAGANGTRRPHVPACSSSARCASMPKQQTGAVWAKPGDDRRTPIGAFLRATQPRRASAALERPHGRHVARRPPARAAGLRDAVPPRDPALHAPPQGEVRASRAGRRSTAGAATRRWTGASSATSTTSATGLTFWTGRSCCMTLWKGFINKNAY